MDVQALVAGLAGVGRVDCNQFHAILHALVAQKQSQLEECPTVRAATLSLVPRQFIGALSNTRQVFNRNDSIQQFLTTFAASTVIISSSSCNTLPDNHIQSRPLHSNSVPIEVSLKVKSKPASQKPSLMSATPAIQLSDTANTVTVTVYEPDSECKTLIAKQIVVPAEKSLLTAVSKVLEQEYTSDFNFAYRVTVDQNTGKAIIDLRVSSNSKRTLTSLSTCQQLAIFGSLRQTLTAKPVWKVKQVQFTSKGADILLLQHLGAYSNGL